MSAPDKPAEGWLVTLDTLDKILNGARLNDHGRMFFWCKRCACRPVDVVVKARLDCFAYVVRIVCHGEELIITLSDSVLWKAWQPNAEPIDVFTE